MIVQKPQKAFGVKESKNVIVLKKSFQIIGQRED
jgi:hypothetical protein